MSECRICAATDAIFLNIFQKNDDRKYDAEINTCLPIKVTTDDVISLKICHVCVHKLELCNAFVCRFLATESQRQTETGQNMCYLCLESDGFLSNLFDGNFNWIHQIETALGCKVHRGKKIPSKICHHCAYKLGELYNLFQSALDSESKLYMMCEFPKVNNQNQNFPTRDTKALKISTKINQQPVPSKSLGNPKKEILSDGIKHLAEKTVVRVSLRKVNATKTRDDVPADMQLNLKATKVFANKLKEADSSDLVAVADKVKGKYKQTKTLRSTLAGRKTRQGFVAQRVKPENKQKNNKVSKTMLKPADNITIACWKCYRDLKDNETCSCSTDFDANIKARKPLERFEVDTALNDVTLSNKTDKTDEGIARMENKRKRETEDLDDDSSKKVRGSGKKILQKKRESFPLVSHVYDIRRTKRKRTITDYNQFLNDGLLLSPRVDKRKKDIKPVLKAMPLKESVKTSVSRQSQILPPRSNSHKLIDIKLENQENVPRKHLLHKVRSINTSKLKDKSVNLLKNKQVSPKDTKTSKSPKKKVPKEKVSQEETATVNNLCEEPLPLPPEKLNKYECSVCGTLFPSTVEGKLHEITHTGRIMNLIMYRWADSRSNNQSSPSKQPKKNAGKASPSKTSAKQKSGGDVTKEIKNVLQDVVSLVSKDPSAKLENVNGSKITRTRTGRIVVSKLQVTRILKKERNKGSKNAADTSKHDETVRSIISDFESLEEGEESFMDSSLATVVEDSSATETDNTEAHKHARKNNALGGLQDLDDSLATSPVGVDLGDIGLENSKANENKSTAATRSTSEVQSKDNDRPGSPRDTVREIGTCQDESKQLGPEKLATPTESTEVVSCEAIRAGCTDHQESDTIASEVSKPSPSPCLPIEVDEDDIEVYAEERGSSASSSVIVEDASFTDPHFSSLVDSSYNMHTSIEKEIYELHGVDEVELSPPKSSGSADSVRIHEGSESGDKIAPVSNENDLLQILE